MWAQLHYAKSPLVRSVRTVGPSTRYILDPGHADLELVGSRFAAGISGVAVEGDEIAISYIGLGGGGVGASGCRSLASGVTRSICDPSGGGKKQGRRSGSRGGSASSSASMTQTRLRRGRRGRSATTSRRQSRTRTRGTYRTRSCSSFRSPTGRRTALPLSASSPRGTPATWSRPSRSSCPPTRSPLRRAWPSSGVSTRGPSSRSSGGRSSGGKSPAERLAALERGGLGCVMRGRGLIGAAASIPFYTRYQEALELCDGTN